jgi:predicted phosphoadenosine phosphosulfate sulfurtransferase
VTRIYHPEKNVYEASRERIKFVFDNFERIYLSFSGGKDSGVMLNLVLDYMRENNITKKIGLMTLDNEANYEYSLEFMHRIIKANLDLLDVYWCCLPITLPCTVSSYSVDWKCWGVEDEERWIRPLPKERYIKTINNHPFDFFEKDMMYDKFWDEFGEWYSQGKRTACLIGIRTEESLNRFRALMNERKETLQGEIWTKRNGTNVFNCYPIYDWKTEDIWTANAQFDWDYNKLYDIFYMAGLTVHQMRVASPFMSESKSSLNLYRVIDPQVWSRLCARVGGANFIATYGKQLDYKSFKLPEGHTWKSFVKFLLETLPEEVAGNFRDRFAQSLKFWARVGRGLPTSVIEQLRKSGIPFTVGGLTAHGRGNKRRVKIVHPPDHLDCLKTNASDVTSWKRFGICILKNDHTCKYLGLMPTQELQRRQKAIQEKYGSVLRNDRKKSS